MIAKEVRQDIGDKEEAQTFRERPFVSDVS
jgi:hypothetical protein